LFFGSHAPTWRRHLFFSTTMPHRVMVSTLAHAAGKPEHLDGETAKGGECPATRCSTRDCPKHGDCVLTLVATPQDAIWKRI